MEDKMKIVYMGTPDFAVAPLEALLAAGHTVTCGCDTAGQAEGAQWKTADVPG